MNSQNNFAEEKENWLGIKYVREKYLCERFKSLRNKFVTENRKKMESVVFQNTNQFIEIVNKQNHLIQELNHIQKLRSSQNKEIKLFFIFLRNLSKEDQKLFSVLIENDSFILLHKIVLEEKNCSYELKHEALWNIAIASNFKLPQDKVKILAGAVSSLSNKLSEFQKMDQIVFLEKMLFALTNFIIDHPSINEVLKYQINLQKFATCLLDENNSDHISLSLWFMRNLLKNTKTSFQGPLETNSIQNSILTILKNYQHDNSLLFETFWTLTHISEIPVNFEIIKQDLLLMVLQVAINKEEFVLLPTLSIIANSLHSLSDESLKNVIDSIDFNKLLQITLSSSNFLIKREALFLLSNMAAKTKESAYFIIQKNDLMCFLTDILKNKEPFLYKEALYIIYNLCFVEDNYYFAYLNSVIDEIYLFSNNLVEEKVHDQEIIVLLEKLYKLKAEN